MPEKNNETDACFDVFVRIPGDGMEFFRSNLGQAWKHKDKDEWYGTLKKDCMVRVPLGFKIGIPPGYEMRIRGRSGLAAQGIYVHPGTIDAGYGKEIECLVSKISPIADYDDPFKVHMGFRLYNGLKIAQISFHEVMNVELREVGEGMIKDLRGGGFGASGK